ncbi:MAG: SCP2 sterol-binding domain-containing protein [Promethearchaeia archaeon]
MLNIEKPNDLLSLAIYNILNHRKDDEFYNLVKDWNKKIVVHISEFYPVTIIFQGDEIKFERGEDKKANLKIKMNLDTMLDIAYGEIGAIAATLRGKIRIKGIYKIRTLLRFIKIFLKSISMVAADPCNSYLDIEKMTKWR